ncbi:MAG: ferric reductase-like transmembrane domain-containing protein [Bacilli bacterium]
MIAVILVLLLGLGALYFGNTIRKKATILYFIILLLSAIAFYFREISLFLFINQGFLGFSFFYLVMLAGALKNQTNLRKKLIGVRKEYSILGFLSILPHAIGKLLLGLTGELTIAWFGIATFIIMIPLFITSFSFIRRKMSPKSWSSLQKLAYVIYLLIMVHLIVNYTKIIGLIIYILLFTIYITFKLVYEIRKYRVKMSKKAKA